MNLEQRITKLEDRIGIGDEIPPLIRIDIQDCSRDSVDKGRPAIAIIPGKVGGVSGLTLFRDADENPANFLERCESEYQDFYS